MTTGNCPVRNHATVHGKATYQSGAVLIISLIMLLLLTLIGTTSMQTTSLEEKMAGNMRDRNLAFQAAESALNAGESEATTAAKAALPITCPGANPPGYYLPFDANCDGTKETTPIWDYAAIWSDNNKSVKLTINLAHLSENPRYIIEYMGITCTTNVTPCPSLNQKKTYRVTSRAVGGSANTVVMLQSIFWPG